MGKYMDRTELAPNLNIYMVMFLLARSPLSLQRRLFIIRGQDGHLSDGIQLFPQPGQHSLPWLITKQVGLQGQKMYIKSS